MIVDALEVKANANDAQPVHRKYQSAHSKCSGWQGIGRGIAKQKKMPGEYRFGIVECGVVGEVRRVVSVTT